MAPQPSALNCVQCSKSDVIDSTASDVAEIKDALIGSEFHPVGLIAKQQKDHIRINRIERLIYIGTGAGLVAGFLLKFIF